MEIREILLLPLCAGLLFLAILIAQELLNRLPWITMPAIALFFLYVLYVSIRSMFDAPDYPPPPTGEGFYDLPIGNYRWKD
jgi:predicted Abi (CAAX) family protease